MSRILVIGDSQAGNPGAAAKTALEARGHTVTQIHNDGHGPTAYVSQPSLWQQYTQNAADADIVLLIFGHNDLAGSRSRAALEQMRTGVHAPVWMSGPPLYPANAEPTSGGQPSRAAGDALRAQNQQVFGSHYIDAYPSTPESLPRDSHGWHFTPASAQGWGHAMAAAIDQAARSGGGGTGRTALIVGGVLATLALGAGALAFSRRR